jgi:hypothetical protein
VIRRLPLVLGALVAFHLGQAEAGGHFGGGHFSGGAHYSGGAHFSGGVRYGTSVNVGVRGGGYYGGGVHYGYSRGYGGRGYYGYGGYRYGWRGGIYVGGYYGWGCGWPYYCGYSGYPYYYGADYVPSYYGGSYYPVATGPSAAAAVAVVPPRPQLPRFGIGASAGFVSSDLNTSQGQTETDLSLLGRFRLTPGLLVEAELGRTSYDVSGTAPNGQSTTLRVDRRLGGSLIYEIGAYNKFAPYILVGLGVQQANVNGNYNTTQDFAEVGAGLRYALTRNLHITADIRAGSRGTMSNDTMTAPPPNSTAASIAPPTSTSGQNEGYTRARLAAILYF